LRDLSDSLKSAAVMILVAAFLLSATGVPLEVNAAELTLSPPQLTITQGSTFTTFNIEITGMPNTGYSLSVSGIPGIFSPSSLVTTDGNGFAYAEFSVDFGFQPYGMNFGPPYCPGTSYFTISAQSANGDSGSVGGSITVLPPGPLQMTVSTDKPAYTQGGLVSITISLDRAAHGTITVTSPLGQIQNYGFVSTAATPTLITKTIQATAPFGTWTVAVQANDYCGITNTMTNSFVVNPIMYTVYVSLEGVPATASAGVQVDGAGQGTIAGGQIDGLSLSNATGHTISVDENVAGLAGIRYHCPQNTWHVNSSGKHTFNYQVEYQLSVSTDPEGVFPTTSEWYESGNIVKPNPAPETVQGQTPGVKYVFNYWQVDGVIRNGNLTSFAMNRPHTAVAKYSVQYLLTVISPNNVGNPQGSGYYDAGTVANFSVSSPVGYLVQQVFAEWVGDVTGTSSHASIVMTKPTVVRAVWVTSYIQLFSVIGAAFVIAIALFVRRKREDRGRPIVT